MIEKIQVQEKKLNDYKKFVSPELLREINVLAGKLKGKKIVHVNSTSRLGGGGVAEILHSLIALMRDAGVEADWYIIKSTKKFFKITNKIHNNLQGFSEKITKSEKDYYLSQSEKFARELEKLKADYYVIHDPQPLACCRFSDKISPSVLRIHVDLSSPNADTWGFLFPFIKNYQRVIISTHEFANNKIPKEKIIVIPPAIDPLKAKNMPMKREYARMILENLGINPSKPLISQVSRLDPFKDPIGVIQSFYLAKKDIFDLQLVLLAQNLANDNPLSRKIFEDVKRYAKGDPDIHIFYEPEKIQYENDILVNAVQTASDIVLQKSVKEGFGLTVTEAMWKGKAVIAGRVGGIKIQIRDGYNGYMVSSVEHCASKIVELMKDKKLRVKLGRHAKESVAKNFLMPRLLRDHLRLADEVLNV
jgi:trehalose synthase